MSWQKKWKGKSIGFVIYLAWEVMQRKDCKVAWEIMKGIESRAAGMCRISMNSEQGYQASKDLVRKVPMSCMQVRRRCNFQSFLHGTYQSFGTFSGTDNSVH